jgi:hypothetical protein
MQAGARPRLFILQSVGFPQGPTCISSTMQTLTSPQMWLDDRGTAWVDDTNTKVREIALDVIAHSWSPPEIHCQHPHLSLAQIHARGVFIMITSPSLIRKSRLRCEAPGTCARQWASHRSANAWPSYVGRYERRALHGCAGASWGRTSRALAS